MTSAAKQAAAFNKKHPLLSVVQYQRRKVRTTSIAFVAGGEARIIVTGEKYGVPLSEVKPLAAARSKVAKAGRGK